MPCYHPLSAFRLASGAVVFVERGDVVASLFLPCGQCIGCRLERSRQWACRIMHECQMHSDSCFITLTYKDLSSDSLVYLDFQKFMRRLRKEVGAVRFFVCGEYGEDFARPHFHACIFGFGFRGDRILWKKSGGGFNVYRSALLEFLWPHGFSSVGELTFESAAYVARYVVKKVTGDKERVSRHYRKIDLDTGEIVWREREFVHMSLKPGIGAKWFERFSAEVFPLDRVIARGVPCKPPKYYDYLAKCQDAVMIEDVKFERMVRAVARGDNGPERLAVKELVTKARVASYRRELK